MKRFKIGVIASGLFIVWLLSGCAYTPQPILQTVQAEVLQTPTPASVPTSTSAADAAMAADDRRFSVSAQQAREVATAIRLIDAYNDGRLTHVLALLTDDVG